MTTGQSTFSKRTGRPLNGDGQIRIPVGIFYFLILAVVIPLFVLMSSRSLSDVPWSTALVLQLLILAVSSHYLAKLFNNVTHNWAELAFWSFSYVWLGLSALEQLISDTNPLRIHFSYETEVTQGLVVLAGLISFVFGTKLYLMRPESGNVENVSTSRVLQRSRVVVTGWVTTAIFPVLFFASGGSAAFFSSREERLGFATAGADGGSLANAALLGSATSVLPVVSLLSLLVLKRERMLHGRGSETVLLIFLSMITVIVANPISSARFWSLTVGLAIMWIYLAGKSAFALRVSQVLYVFSASILFPYLDAFRYSASSSIVQRIQPISYFYQSKGDYDAMTQIGNCINFVSDSGIAWGRQFLGSLFFFIPRSWWSDKPKDTGEVLAASIDFPNGNLSAPLWAELYINGGEVLVVVGFLVVGYVVRKYSTLYELRLPLTSIVTVGFPLLAAYATLVLRGSLLQATGRGVAIVLLLFILSARQPVLSPQSRLRKTN